MTRLRFWNLCPRIRLEARFLCSQPPKYCLRYISSCVSFNYQTICYLDKSECQLLHNKQHTGECLVRSRMSSFLTNASFRSSSHVPFTDSINPLNSKHDVSAGHHQGLLLKSSHEIQQTRSYKNKKQREDESSASEDELEESDVEDEDLDFPLGYKDRKSFVKSLRADAIISSGLALSRNSVDEIFLKSGLKLNGVKLLKKSKMLEEDDYVDVIVEKNEDKLRIKRVKILKVLPERTQKDRIAVKLRIWKTAFEIEDEDKTQW